MASMAILTTSQTFLKSKNHDSIKSITTFAFLSQEQQLAEASAPASPSAAAIPLPPNLAPGSSAPASPSAVAIPLPPNPDPGSPFYNENWQNPIPSSTGPAQSLIPLGFVNKCQVPYLGPNVK